jgi:hypothetical protein
MVQDQPRQGTSQTVDRSDACHAMDPFPHLQAMDRNIGIDVKTQSHFSILDRQHRNFKRLLEAIGSADHDRLLVFSG